MCMCHILVLALNGSSKSPGAPLFGAPGCRFAPLLEFLPRRPPPLLFSAGVNLPLVNPDSLEPFSSISGTRGPDLFCCPLPFDSPSADVFVEFRDPLLLRELRVPFLFLFLLLGPRVSVSLSFPSSTGGFIVASREWKGP